MFATKAILVLFFTFILHKTGLSNGAKKYWQGNWFPSDPGAADTNDFVDASALTSSKNRNDLRDDKHGIKMGVVDKSCDDGKTNLTVDWDYSTGDYTCFNKRYVPDPSIQPVKYCNHIPKGYVAQHYCMNTSITYHEKIPNFGPHRPLWPIFGEYTFVPISRWLHCLEHRAVVMLYHPCANKKEVSKLKKLVKNCMWKHLIAANPDLTEKRPIVLLTWGCSMYMNKVDQEIVINFIKNYGMKGPEENYRDGFYDLGLKYKAEIVSDEKDSVICPFYNLNDQKV